jgi:3-oxocholest-4-en-26-oate---CoA ligase
VVATRPGHEVTLPAIEAFCRASIAGYKIPRHLRVVDQVVRQPSGKPDYRWAREAALAEPR